MNHILSKLHKGQYNENLRFSIMRKYQSISTPRYQVEIPVQTNQNLEKMPKKSDTYVEKSIIS